MNRRNVARAAFIAATLCTGAAAAEPYRLRADAYASGQDAITGLLVLDGQARARSWIDAQAVVWVGTGSYPADVLVASVRAHDPTGIGELRLGRLMVTAGAIRPVHLDGADVIGRAPWGSTVEVFGGSPVVRDYASRDYDWVVGGRASQRVSSYGTLGVSYLQMRQTGALAYEEVGLDATALVTKYLSGAFSGAYDLARPGISDARVSLAGRFAGVRIEGFALQRSPSHMLPATSLFAALGDVPSQRAGGSVLWRAAPRLDIAGEASAESLGGELGGQFLFRTVLRLDERGNGALGLELRRQGAPGASWSGVRGTVRVPFARMFSASTELELVRPDEARGRGAVWPWGLVALSVKPIKMLEIAGAVEASASPEHVSALGGILRVSGVLGGR